MLHTQTARNAIAAKNAHIASILERMSQGACCHGHFDFGYDMEQACLACEFEGYQSPIEQGYLAAKNYIRMERDQKLANDIAQLVKFFHNQPAVLIWHINQVIDEYKEGR